MYRLSRIAFLSTWLPLLAGCETFVCSLEVINGTGSGDYALGQMVTVKADVSSRGFAFDKWIGDVDRIADVTQEETSFMVTAGESRIEATYKLVACYLFVVNGSGSGTYAPNQAVGIRANAPPAGSTFFQWVGDVDGVIDPTQPETMVVLNRADTVVEATYIGGSAPPPGSNLPPPSSFTYITGDKRDAGREIWIGNFQGMDIRLSANDVTNLRRNGVPAQGSWYPLDSAVMGSAASLGVAADGGIIASGRDFVSPRTGLKYHFCGFMVQTTSSPLLQVDSITIPREQSKMTLRFMFATVAD